MLACLLAALASGSFARFHCDVCSFFFSTSSLPCSFCFHVDSNRATAHASNERRLSASRDPRIHTDGNDRTVPVASTRVARNASFVPLQKKRKSLVSMLPFCFAMPALLRVFGVRTSWRLFRAIVKWYRYDGTAFFVLRCQRHYAYF